jgi:CubicO group peptidase (beta-lactamase class C family)
MSDYLDGFVVAQMQEHQIPGVSLAIVSDGKIIKEQGYGFTDRTGTGPIITSTLFQAASVSKCLAALAALRLVGQGELSLDGDVNSKLQSWKIPSNEFSKKEPVTLRRLLSHSAGVTVHGFPGYTVGLPIPSLTEILNGMAPAKNPAICIDAVPGSGFHYSGGGYTILQQLLVDVVGRPFPELMQSLVLQPLGMASSTFDQPLLHPLNQCAATGHTQNGKPVPGGARVYPEMAAAGLWTTPSDLACFVIGVQQSIAGRPNSILSSSLAREMLMPQSAGYGLGPGVSVNGKSSTFFHSGRNAGFDAALMAGTETGKGVVIMTNVNADPKVLNSILKRAAGEFP